MPRLRVITPVSVHIRLPKELHKALTAKARAEHRTLNSVIVLALRDLLAPPPSVEVPRAD